MRSCGTRPAVRTVNHANQVIRRPEVRPDGTHRTFSERTKAPGVSSPALVQKALFLDSIREVCSPRRTSMNRGIFCCDSQESTARCASLTSRHFGRYQYTTTAFA
jgi:hypothetical protein